MKIDITGASNFVNRMFEACGSFQWAREFLKNAQEADAKRVEFGIEWQAVEKLGVYRRTVADDGWGMDRQEIVRFFSKLGEGGKPIGGVHQNFGVGAKIASLPWNPEGVVILSWKDGEGSMIWIRLDPDSGDYELVAFESGDGQRNVVLDPEKVDWTGADPEAVDWGEVKPSWIEESGTVIVLLGSEDNPDTVLGNPDAKENQLKGLARYLNTRFWNLSDMQVHVEELSTSKKNRWPTEPSDSESKGSTQRRRIQGARYFLTEVGGNSRGGLTASDVKYLDDDRVFAEWYLWKGERPNVNPYAKRGGYVAVRYNDELFHLTSRKVEFRWFGIIESEVQHRTTIVLEPRHYDSQSAGKWGVHPDQSRNRLIFSGEGDKGVEMPLSGWGAEFADNMPGPIYEAIMDARGDQAGRPEDEEYRKRLQDKFGDRWRTRRLVVSENGESDDKPVDPQEGEEEVAASFENKKSRSPRRKRKRTHRVRLKRARQGENEEGSERSVPVDVPRYDFKGSEDFDKPWHLATWAPRDPEGPTVYINKESGILEEVVEYHQEKYAEVYHEEVGKVVREVFGEVAACKVAHSQKLASEIPEEELDQSYRNEAALTVGLMGLIAEESLIGPRLGRFGPQRSED